MTTAALRPDGEMEQLPASARRGAVRLIVLGAVLAALWGLVLERVSRWATTASMRSVVEAETAADSTSPPDAPSLIYRAAVPDLFNAVADEEL